MRGENGWEGRKSRGHGVIYNEGYNLFRVGCQQNLIPSYFSPSHLLFHEKVKRREGIK